MLAHLQPARRARSDLGDRTGQLDQANPRQCPLVRGGLSAVAAAAGLSAAEDSVDGGDAASSAGGKAGFRILEDFFVGGTGRGARWLRSCSSRLEPKRFPPRSSNQPLTSFGRSCSSKWPPAAFLTESREPLPPRAASRSISARWPSSARTFPRK